MLLPSHAQGQNFAELLPEYSILILEHSAYPHTWLWVAAHLRPAGPGQFSEMRKSRPWNWAIRQSTPYPASRIERESPARHSNRLGEWSDLNTMKSKAKDKIGDTILTKLQSSVLVSKPFKNRPWRKVRLSKSMEILQMRHAQCISIPIGHSPILHLEYCHGHRVCFIESFYHDTAISMPTSLYFIHTLCSCRPLKIINLIRNHYFLLIRDCFLTWVQPNLHSDWICHKHVAIHSRASTMLWNIGPYGFGGVTGCGLDVVGCRQARNVSWEVSNLIVLWQQKLRMQ